MTFLLANQALTPWIWLLIGVLAAVGLLAMFSPRRFASLALRGSNWVDTNRFLAVFDKRIDIDQHVLPFSRVLGLAVLASAVLFAVLLCR